jgi:hypothetical protein
MASSLVKAPGQNVFDPVNLGCYVARRKSGDLGNRGGVETFQIGNDDLAVERLQLPDEFEEPIHGSTSVRCGLAIFWIGCAFRLFERDKRQDAILTLPVHMRGGGVVRHAVDPSSQGAAPIETFEATPQREVDLLKKILTTFRVGLISSREALECGMESGGGFTVQVRLTLLHI